MRNGSNFSVNTSDFTTYLAGSVGEKIKAEITVDVSWFVQATAQETITISGNQIFRNSGDWTVDGFTAGDTIYVESFAANQADFAATVSYVDPTTIILTANSGQNYTMTSGFVYGTTPMDALIFDYGLIENNENTNYLSKIDSSDQQFYASGIDAASPSAVNMQPIQNGLQKTWQNGSATVAKTSTTPDGSLQTFKITHEFILLPYFLDGYLQNLQNGTIPALFNGANSLKYVFRVNFRDQLSNPNSNKEKVEDSTLGSVGFFNQNFNGFNVDYTPSNLVYTNFDTIGVQNITGVSFKINSQSGNFAGGEPFIVGVSYLPESSDLISSEDYETNFIYEVLRNEVGAAAVSGSIITDLEATFVNANEYDVTLNISYNALQQAKLDNTKNYVIWILVGDGGKTNGADDRVPVLVDTDLYDFNADVAGLLTLRGQDSQFFNHCIDYTSTGHTDFKGWIQDSMLWKINPIYQLASNESKIIDAAFILGAHNATTGEFFELQRYDFDIAGNSVIVPAQVGANTYNIQQININTTRGFKLASGDQFNFVKWSTNFTGEDIVPYEILIGFQINWEDWILNNDVSTVFYDINEPNNGFNNQSNRYSLKQGFAIVARLDCNVQDNNGGTTRYVFESPDAEVENFGDTGEGEKQTWCCTTGTTDIDDTVNLNGDYLTSDDTKVRLRVKKCDNTTFNPADICGELRIDIENGGQYTIERLSTFRPFVAGQKLIPLSGESNAKIEVDPSNLYVDIVARVDKTKIKAGDRLCLSGWMTFYDEITNGDVVVLTEGMSSEPLGDENTISRPIKVE